MPPPEDSSCSPPPDDGDQPVPGFDEPEEELSPPFDLIEANDADGLRGWLKEHGHPDSVRDSDGYTPLMCACDPDRLECLDLLLAAGADPNAQTPNGTPLAIIAGCRYDNLAVLEKLFEAGLDPNAAEPDGDTVLHNASADNEHIEVVRIFLRHGANPNVARSSGETPRTMAACWGAKLVTQELLAAGGDPNQREECGASALSVTTSVGYHDPTGIVAILLQSGADPDIPERGGYTPLHWSACHGHVRAAELLIPRVNNLSPKNDEGQTPLELARERGHPEIVALLQAAGAER